jgi:hypothetical protein
MLKNYLKNHLTSIFILLFSLFGMTDALAGGCTAPGAPGSADTTNITCTSFRANWNAACCLQCLATKWKFLLMLHLQQFVAYNNLDVGNVFLEMLQV